MSRRTKTTVLIDADIVAYRAAVNHWSSCELDGLAIENAHPELAIAEALAKVEAIRKATHAQDVVLAFTSSKSNFRKALYKQYKANRPSKPSIYAQVAMAMSAKYPTDMVKGLEADDILGIRGTGNPSRYIIASIDKDLVQIPCVRLYNWDTGRTSLATVAQANHAFHMQILTGDATDNYPGCPGIGPVKARKILSCSDPIAAIREAYKDRGLNEAAMLTQARLARILRSTDFDPKSQEPILWTP